MDCIKVFISGLLGSLVLVNVALADSVAIPHSFVSGTPAVAAEVNENFDAVAGAVNGNDGAIKQHVSDSTIHHARYSDVEAQAAMGSKANANALNHDRYTDAEAVSAAEASNRFQQAYRQTVVVSPVGTAVENGAHLLSRLAGIVDAASDKPYLLKIEPGVYDVGAHYLLTKPYVDVEGSGVGMTRITSNQILSTQGTVVLTDYTSLRNLTVENLTAGQATGVMMYGVTQGRMTNVTVRVTATSRTRGVYIGNAKFTLDRIKIDAGTSNATTDCDALAVYNSAGTIADVDSRCNGGARTTGLYFYNANVDVSSSMARAESGQSNIGMLTMSSDLGPYTVKAYHSRFYGAQNSVRATGAFNVYIGAGQLEGGDTYVDIGSLTCIGVFDENFVNTGGYNACP